MYFLYFFIVVIISRNRRGIYIYILHFNLIGTPIRKGIVGIMLILYYIVYIDTMYGRKWRMRL